MKSHRLTSRSNRRVLARQPAPESSGGRGLRRCCRPPKPSADAAAASAGRQRERSGHVHRRAPAHLPTRPRGRRRSSSANHTTRARRCRCRCRCGPPPTCGRRGSRSVRLRQPSWPPAAAGIGSSGTESRATRFQNRRLGSLNPTRILHLRCELFLLSSGHRLAILESFGDVINRCASL